MRRFIFPLFTIVAFVLAGCGGATSESDDVVEPSVTSSLPKASREDVSESASAEPSGRSEDPSLVSASPERREAAPQPVVPPIPEPRDGAAREIDKIPGLAQDRSAADLAYLKELREGGISVDGIEDQMIGAAAEVCRSAASGVDNYTLEAVAGQLIEQARASASVEVVADRIASAAKSAYC
ncbi:MULTISPECIES: DUF732 domain-containing protein [unclassified Corynebacterium]|uniref:DUF732 domain-containing protein n=1 Tax=unclassified Corynebacterium TaxID=2624378 RepID=UPI003524B69C